jgi:hypothetical protein
MFTDIKSFVISIVSYKYFPDIICTIVNLHTFSGGVMEKILVCTDVEGEIWMDLATFLFPSLAWWCYIN